MQAGGNPWVGRLQDGSAPWRLASSTRAAEGPIARRVEHRLGVGDRPREAARVLVELDDDVGVVGGDAFLVLDEVGGDPEQQAGIARLAGDEASDRVGDGQGPAQAADVAVSHQAGGHDRVEQGVERHRRSRAATGAIRMAAPMPAVVWPVRCAGHAALQGGQDLAEAPADAPVGTDERALRRRQAQVEIGQPLLVDPPIVEQDVAERQGLLRVVGIEAAQPPAIRLPLPGLDAVDVVPHPTVVRLDLLGAQPLERGAQGVAHGQTQQAPSNTVNSRQMRHRGSAPRMPNRTPGSRGRFRLGQTNRKITAWPNHANRNLPSGPTIDRFTTPRMALRARDPAVT